MKAIVITTINGETPAIQKYKNIPGWELIVVGDKKTPDIKSSGNMTFLSVQDQEKLGYKILQQTPYNQYCRKNIGYLFAIKNGAEFIYETDDDNHPYDDWCVPNNFTKTVTTDSDFLNICSLYTKENIWPRGYPLELIRTKENHTILECNNSPGVIQTLADKDPDVDAVYRLTTQNKDIQFEKGIDLIIHPGVYTPINSQSTFWKKEFFPLMYFPMFVGWRFADILRGYIAQKLLWSSGSCLGYSSPIVYQERNEHNYMVDFNQELILYNAVVPLVRVLKNM